MIHSHVQPQYAICRIGCKLTTFASHIIFRGFSADPQLCSVGKLARRCTEIYNWWISSDRQILKRIQARLNPHHDNTTASHDEESDDEESDDERRLSSSSTFEIDWQDGPYRQFPGERRKQNDITEWAKGIQLSSPNGQDLEMNINVSNVGEHDKGVAC